MNAEIYKDALANALEETDIPAEYSDKAQEYREAVIDAIA